MLLTISILMYVAVSKMEKEQEKKDEMSVIELGHEFRDEEEVA